MGLFFVPYYYTLLIFLLYSYCFVTFLLLFCYLPPTYLLLFLSFLLTNNGYLSFKH